MPGPLGIPQEHFRMTNEAFARVKIDALLAAQAWDTLDTNAVRFEVQLPDGTRADRVLCDRHGHALTVIEAKRYSVDPGDAVAQGKAYARSRISSVVDGATALADVKSVALAPADRGRMWLVDGDVLFVRTKGNPDFVGVDR